MYIIAIIVLSLLHAFLTWALIGYALLVTWFYRHPGEGNPQLGSITMLLLFPTVLMTAVLIYLRDLRDRVSDWIDDDGDDW